MGGAMFNNRWRTLVACAAIFEGVTAAAADNGATVISCLGTFSRTFPDHVTRPEKRIYILDAKNQTVWYWNPDSQDKFSLSAGYTTEFSPSSIMITGADQIDGTRFLYINRQTGEINFVVNSPLAKASFEGTCEQTQMPLANRARNKF